jgi:hypothetical protein
MVKAGLARLAGMQNADGGFGWFGGMHSDPWMTGYVLHGLTQAVMADFSVPPDMIRRAADACYADLHLVSRDTDTSAWLAWVLSEASDIGAAAPSAAQLKELHDTEAAVYAAREDLNDYTRALLILSLKHAGAEDQAQVVWRNLQARRIETATGCHWGENRWGWRWSEDQVETTAYALLASQAVEPDNPLAAKTVQWLVLNRTGNQWYSTKDTSAAIYALSVYADKHHELTKTYSATVSVNGHQVKGWEVTPAGALDLKASVEVDPQLLHDGDNEVTLSADGGGAPYYSARLTYYSLEDPIKAASNLISASRRYYRVTEYTDKDKHRQVKRDLLRDGDTVASGEQIEVEVTVNAENDFSYVAFSDPKPAGCEPVDQTSGGTWGGAWLYRELRDREVDFFADHLAQGQTVFTYRLRAETPGTFRALPHHGFAMYRPDVACLSDEAVIKIGERP